MAVRVKRRLIISGLVTAYFLCFTFISGWAQVVEEPRLSAPGGSEIDLLQNVTQCFGTEAKPVEARWKTYSIEAKYLEYSRKEDMIRAKNSVKIKQNIPVYRVVTCNELFLDLKRDILTSQKEVKIVYDEKTSLEGDSLEWDRRNDRVKVAGTAQICYQDWKITGERIEGQLNKGVFVFYGPVKGTGEDSSLSAGQVLVDLAADKLFLKDNPVVVQGKNKFTADEIVYDLKTRKVSSKSGTEVN